MSSYFIPNNFVNKLYLSFCFITLSNIGKRRIIIISCGKVNESPQHRNGPFEIHQCILAGESKYV